MYSATVKLIWRDHAQNYAFTSQEKTFTGKDQMDVYEYIKYYTLAFGITDVEMIQEGDTHET